MQAVRNIAIIAHVDHGKTSLVNVWNFVAPSDFNSKILFLSVAKNPFSIVIIVTIIVIIIAINTIDLVPAPNHTIIIGPNAILGKLFKITIYGSITPLINSLHQSSSAKIVPSTVAIKKPNKVSYKVVEMCKNNSPDKNRSFIVIKILDGILIKNGSMILSLPKISQMAITKTKIKTLVKFTINLFNFLFLM